MIQNLVYWAIFSINSWFGAGNIEDKLLQFGSNQSEPIGSSITVFAPESDRQKALRAIEKAMKADDYERLPNLLRAYCKFDDRSQLGDLFFWSSCNQKETELLIKAGANVNYKKYYKECDKCLDNQCNEHVRFPLLYKLCTGNISQATSLIAAGASLHCRDHLGRTPVHMAVLLARSRDNIEPIYEFLCQAQILNKESRILLDFKDKNDRCAMDILHEDEKLVFEGSKKWTIGDESIKQEFGSIRSLILKVESNPIFRVQKLLCERSLKHF